MSTSPSPRRRHLSASLALLVASAWLAAACDRSDDAGGERAYHAECEVTIGPAEGPPIHEARGDGADRDSAYAAAFAEACAAAGLGADCHDNTPDDVRTNRVGCVSVTLGTGSTLSAGTSTTGFGCTVRVIDERSPLRFDGVAEMEGSSAETDDLEPLCQQAIDEACAAAGAAGDCTAGDNPAWRVMSRGEGRQLAR